MATPRAATSNALRLARRAWKLLHADSARSFALAERALAAAVHDRDAEPWARLVLGFNQLFLATPPEAIASLTLARHGFDRLGDRAGHILALAGLARAHWRQGRFRAALEMLLPLRDEGLQVLRHEQRGVLLNAVAGCYSVLGDSEQAFAYMYAALRDSRPARASGFDAALHCNLAHEMLQLGDCEEALLQVDVGVARCQNLANPRLLSALLINRVICLTELGRAAEALPDIERVRAIPPDASGRGRIALHYETLAIAALRAGRSDLGAELLGHARTARREDIADEHVELALAEALLAQACGDPAQAQRLLSDQQDRLLVDVGDGLSLRVRCSALNALSELQERSGRAQEALATVRAWQQHHAARSNLASRARYQAAALQTELLWLRQKLEENDARRRATEKARAELQAINEQLSNKIAEVQQLQAALHEQATRDALTGLFNRRHLNDSLPAMFALARREQLPLAVAIIDHDHFKAVNDRHGHDAGDRLLADFGALLAGSGRRSDVACRYGGEEFCLLLPRTDARSAARKLWRLLRRWQATTLEHAGRRIEGLSFSAGVSDSQLATTCWEDLLKSADEALLRAKSSGRGRVLEAPLAVAAAAC